MIPKIKFKINKNTKLYLLCPASYASGGPEAIHRLCEYLRIHLNINAMIFYLPAGRRNPTPNNYKKLKISVATHIDDSEENIVISPEIYNFILFMRKFKKINKAIWWLSVDYFYISYIKHNKSKINKIITKIKSIFNKLLNNNKKNDDEINFNKKNIEYIDSKLSEIIKGVDFHFCQSQYANNWLNDRNIKNVAMMTDSFDELIIGSNFDRQKKKKIVAYNPSKGLEFTAELIKNSPEISFIPIINMDRLEVVELLQSAMIYIDFGNHPGQDRLPREAVIYGCCVLTGLRGSAKHYEDVPIEPYFKFSDDLASIPMIKSTILEIFSKYDEFFEKFKNYRQFSLESNIRYESHLKNIFEGNNIYPNP